MASVIFSGDRLKALKSALKLAEGTTIATGSVDPTSVAPGISLSPGSIYMSTSTGGVYIKHTTTANDTNFRQIPNLTASLGSGRVIFTDTGGNLTSEAELTYDSVANKLAAEQITTTSIQRATNGTLNIGTDSTAQIINIGNSGATVNVQGTTAFQNVTNYEVADKAITINNGGSAGSAASAGLEVEEANSITGYVRTNPTRDGWIFKAPANSGEFEVLPPTATHNIILDFEAQAGSRTYTYPVGSATLASLNLSETFTSNKTFSGTLNLSALSPSTILKLDASNNVTAALLTNADVNPAAGITYGKLNLSNSIVNTDIATAAAIARSKLASGTANHVLINDGTGVMSSESALSASRGGLGTSGASFTGVVKANAGVFSASTIVNADVSASAAIARSKLANGTGNRMVVNNATGTMIDAAAITAARALISDANGIPTHSTVTSTELGHLSGVTSAIQTQINTVSTDLSNHLSDAADAHDASAISNIPSGNLAATDVQGALNELQTDIDGRATTSLNNLASTAVNADIIPDTNNTKNLGSGTVRWASLHGVFFSMPSDGSGRVGTTNQTGATSSGAQTFRSGTVVDGTSGSATVGTGNVSGTGSSGDVNLIAGTVVSGTRGKVVAAGRYFRPPVATADPGTPEGGATYYNSSTGFLKYYNGTSWVNLEPRPYIFARASNAATLINNTTPIVINGTENKDTSSAYNTSTGRFTVPSGADGDYEITTFLRCGSASWTVGSVQELYIFKNGSQYNIMDRTQIETAGTYNRVLQGTDVVTDCVAGDILDVRAYSDGPVGLDSAYVVFKRLN